MDKTTSQLERRTKADPQDTGAAVAVLIASRRTEARRTRFNKGELLIDRGGSIRLVLASGPKVTRLKPWTERDNKSWKGRNVETKWLIDSFTVETRQAERAKSICDEHYLDESNGGHILMAELADGYWERLERRLIEGLATGQTETIDSRWELVDTVGRWGMKSKGWHLKDKVAEAERKERMGIAYPTAWEDRRQD